MPNLKVALFTGNYNHVRDGLALTLNRWVSFLMDHGVEVMVLGPTIEEPVIDHSGELHVVPSVKMPGRPEYRITTGLTKANREKLEKFNPDIVHIASPDYLGLKAVKWAKKNNVPTVSSYHTHFTSYFSYYNLGFLESLGWKYLRWFYDHCDHIYVPTETMAEELRERNIGRSPNALKIWARGVDTNLFNPSKRDTNWRTKYGFKNDHVVFTFVSRLVWEKNLKLFGDVIEKLQKNYPFVRSVIVGDGPIKSELEERLTDTVFTGFLTGEDLACAYASSDIFFFPSVTETFGNVTLEAMASGLPCLVADAGGSKSLVEHKVNGYRVSSMESASFLKLAEELAVNEELRKKMGEASVKRAKKFTWPKINGRLLENYAEVLGREKGEIISNVTE